MAVRLLGAVLAILLVPALAGAGPRWLLAHVDTTMGLGDQLRLHHALLLLAHGTGRTAVLPPLAITVTDYGAVADVDPADEAALDAALDRALAGRVRVSANLPHTTQLVPFDAWFDVDALATAAGTPLATAARWHAATGGLVEQTLVPASPTGCLPEWATACARAPDGILPPDDAILWDLRVRRRRIACMDAAGDWSSAATGDALLARLREAPVAGATTAATDGLCLRMRLPAALEALRPRIEDAYRPSAALRARADAWRRAHGVRRYLALHWRRSDVLIDHHAQFVGQSPERVSEALRSLVARERLGSFDTVVLLTDDFSRPELARVQRSLQLALGCRVLRWDADAQLARSFDAERQVQAVGMDLALGMGADVLVGTYAGSNFFTLMSRQAGRAFVLPLDGP